VATSERSDWQPGTATGVGSMPGTDFTEAVATVLGELPDLPFLPELPARGLGADMIGRTAALLVDVAVEAGPQRYQVTARPGRVHRRAVDLLQHDLDALGQACEAARPEWVKVQAAGPWTLVAGVELRTGHRVLTDAGARREFAASLAEGLTAHAAEVATRTGARVAVQLDEPSMPAVLAGTVPTPSGYGHVDPVPEPEVEQLLGAVITRLPEPVIVHCCASEPPVGLLRRAGAHAVGVDATLPMPSGTLDELAECWDAGLPLLLGLAPALDPDPEPELRELARPALELADRLGFDRARLAELAVPTPTCGTAEASRAWACRSLALVRDLGRAFVEPPESWSG
jgi:hypothetical protein